MGISCSIMLFTKYYTNIGKKHEINRSKNTDTHALHSVLHAVRHRHKTEVVGEVLATVQEVSVYWEITKTFTGK